MTLYTQEPRETPGAIGVLLANVGTPDAPTAPALRRYLNQFLSDPRVIEPPPARWLWWLILRGLILPTRPAKSAALYKNIWTEAGSPLLTISRRQCELLQAELTRRAPESPIHVEIGMGYGEPSIGRAVDNFCDRGCARLLVLPMFPQYCAATTGSVFDGVSAALRRRRRVPELRFISDYHDEQGYIAALVESVKEYQADRPRPAKLVISFHGIPRRYAEAGDPYPQQCKRTARLFVEAMGLSDGDFLVTYQSRFGREPWLAPYTDETLVRLAREGASPVHALCPGFSADCLETLEEMNITNREMFERAGGKDYHYIPALNDRADHIAALADLCRRHASDWLNLGRSPSAERDAL
jgi:ferrochelatase